MPNRPLPDNQPVPPPPEAAEIRIESDKVQPRAISSRQGQITENGKGQKFLTLSIGKNDRDFTIYSFIELISKQTNTNFIINPKLRGLNEPLQLLSPKPIPADEAWHLFETVLDSQELVPVKTATGWFQIIEKRDAATANIETEADPQMELVPRDVMITRLVPLTYISAAQIKPIFEKMKSKGAQVEVYEPTNTLIIIDTALNIDRMLKILKELDVRDYDVLVEIIPVRYSAVNDFYNLIQQIQSEGVDNAAGTARRGRRVQPENTPQPDGGGGLGVSQLKVIPDPRTNSLVVVGTKAEVDRMKELIDKLDVPTGGPSEKIHVYYLEYADAEELAGTLGAIAGGAVPAVSTSAPANPPGQPGQNVGADTARLQRIRDNLRRAAGGAGEGQEVSGQFEGEVIIIPDVPTNALVISASAADYAILERVIRRLDIRRPQVNIEGLVMELGIQKTREFGFEFRSISQDITQDGLTFFGGTNLAGSSGINTAAGTAALGGTSSTATGTAATAAAGAIPGAAALAIPGVIVGAADGTLQFGDATFLNLAAFVRAVKTDNEVNILSQPNLTTLDNEEAEIIIAQNLPFRTGTSQTTISTLSTIERKDVGLTLRITPQINESDYVRLRIEQEISQVIDSPTGLNATDVGPTTSRRVANTTVVVKHNQTAVIGGLMSEDEVRTESKVPFLGDVPVLGWLFRSDTYRNLKTNLLLFVTPHIIRDDWQAQEETQRRFDQQDEFIERFFDDDPRRTRWRERISRQTDELRFRLNGMDPVPEAGEPAPDGSSLEEQMSIETEPPTTPAEPPMEEPTPAEEP